MLGKIGKWFNKSVPDEVEVVVGEEDTVVEAVEEVVAVEEAGVDEGADAAGSTPAGEAGMPADETGTARRIQTGLLPKVFPPIPGAPPFDLHAFLEPGGGVGGDFYDFWLNEGDKLMLVVGDVSGRGIQAAMFMALCRTYLRAFSRASAEPAKLLRSLNDEISRHNEKRLFMTLVCVAVHLPTGLVEYANAGRNLLTVHRTDGTAQTLPLSDDLPAGFVPGAAFAAGGTQLRPGDSLFMCTDGLHQAIAANRPGDAAAIELFSRAATANDCRAATGQIRTEALERAGAAGLSDDIAVLAYRQLERGIPIPTPGGRSSPLEGDGAMPSLAGLGADPTLSTR